MTPDEAFLKEAVAVLERHKLARLGVLLSRLGRSKGLREAYSAGGVSGAWDHTRNAFGALRPENQQRVMAQLAGAALGGVGGYALTDDDASAMQTLINTGAGMALGKVVGGAAAKSLPRLPGVAKGTEAKAPGAASASETSAVKPEKSPKGDGAVKSEGAPETPKAPSADPVPPPNPRSTSSSPSGGRSADGVSKLRKRLLMRARQRRS